MSGWDGDATGRIECRDPRDIRSGTKNVLDSVDATESVKRVSKVQQRLDALTDVVRRKEWGYAERMVNDWDTES